MNKRPKYPVVYVDGPHGLGLYYKDEEILDECWCPKVYGFDDDVWAPDEWPGEGWFANAENVRDAVQVLEARGFDCSRAKATLWPYDPLPDVEPSQDRRIRVSRGALTYPNGSVAWNGNDVWDQHGDFLSYTTDWERVFRGLEEGGWDTTSARKRLAMNGLKPLAAATHEPPPEPGEAKVLDLVMKDLTARAEEGHKKYGTYLETHNGRDALMDAYQEALDLCMYLRQAIEERK